MAYIKQRANGTWQVQVQHQEHRASKVFPTKGEAKLWASETLLEFRKHDVSGVSGRELFENICARYVKEVSPTKRGSRWEKIRIKAIQQHKAFAGKKLAKIDVVAVCEYRDDRLKTVKGSTVNRELNLLSNIFSVAIKEWRLIVTNPCADVKRPKNPPSRTKLISEEEIEQFLLEIPYNPKEEALTLFDRMAVAFLFAIETAMRCGEICSLKAENIKGNVASLEMTKNGLPRDVPLSKEALRLLTMLPETKGVLFGLNTSQVDTAFRKIRDKIDANFTFHDTRHLAVTRLSKKVDAMLLARIVGHTDLKMTLKYYNPEIGSIAKLLD